MPWALRAGTICASAASTARVVSKVLAPYWLASDSRMPGLPMISASPERSAGASVTVATSPMVIGVRLRTASTALAMAEGSGAGTGVWISTR